MSGSINDINVLDRSPVSDALSQGRTATVNYVINGHEYTMGYYLADGIYPKWATFVTTISCPQSRKNKHFAAMQESRRKDVERAFSVLQARWSIVRGPTRPWDVNTLANIMKACIILHNMIIEDEGPAVMDTDFDIVGNNIPTTFSSGQHAVVDEMFTTLGCIRSGEVHNQL
ncbi:uncharacterized protein LOC119979852 [Tripterygium wilfordii]|uniref:uncharacterized protein LOC119979852 n=1 Tax=Tripterygium wilfordii TaxID=458696 RepID=UPI0018F824DA|nr:uncharacterized protein LOC119979852 [Tripterygium wilfordii]